MRVSKNIECNYILRGHKNDVLYNLWGKSVFLIYTYNIKYDNIILKGEQKSEFLWFF